MPWTDAFKNILLDGGVSAHGTIYASLHSAAPTAGANEISGGSPAYARKALTFASAASGAKALSATVTFDVPACTVAYLGFWSASSGGTYRGYAVISSTTFVAQDVYVLAAGSLDLNQVASAL